MYPLKTQWHTNDTDGFWQHPLDGRLEDEDEHTRHHSDMTGRIDKCLGAADVRAVHRSEQKMLSLNREIVALVAEQTRLSLN
ncbi:hypothetical protein L1D32_09635 [Shewanella insulae]|uniref:hypothetical protein n=1 Tax=Shewanella insulae TaxID=2681496 RepID=UPI001EFE9E5D|nr:hypothetical protein [Shewanella insulae]MCG9738415.1 hypothetical protein [Shewanella insulae]